MEQRRHILELAVLFYSHVEELSNWFSELKAELTSEEVSETYEVFFSNITRELFLIKGVPEKFCIID